MDADQSPGVSVYPSGVLGRLIGANMNVTTDQSITLIAGTKVIRRIVGINPSTSLTVSAGGIYTGANKSGTAIVAAAQLYSALTGAAKFLDLTLAAILGTDILTAAQVFFSLTVAQGVAATMDLYVIGDLLS